MRIKLMKAALMIERQTAEQMRTRLKEIIREKSFRDDREITLASGKKSMHYFNMKPTMLDSEGSYLIANLVLDTIAGLGADYIGGLELGAVPLAASIAPLSHQRGAPIKAFIIRKKTKQHGTQSLIEGLSDDETLEGKKLIIIEDVTTTGGSAIKAIEQVKAAGAEIVQVMTILDREEGARQNFAAAGIELSALLTKSDFI